MRQSKRMFYFAILCATPVLLAVALLRTIGNPTTDLTARETAGSFVQRLPSPNKSVAKVLQIPVAVPKAGSTAFTLISRVIPSQATDRARVAESYGKIPLSFEANQGQAASSVKYYSRGRGYALFLTGEEAVFALSRQDSETDERNQEEHLSSLTTANSNASGDSSVLHMRLLGANRGTKISALDEQLSKTNYFIGEPKEWRTNVPTYARVKYENVYPGVDLLFYGNQQQLEYDFAVSPGGDPNRIKFGLAGARSVDVDGQGNLVVEVAGGALQFKKPLIYQITDGARREIAGNFVAHGAGEVGFRVGKYDHSKPLVIDPVLAYSTYLGGSFADAGNGIAVDSSGNAYIVGSAHSSNFPTTSEAYQPLPGNPDNSGVTGDVFVAKLNSSGTALIYSTYIGGFLDDVAYGIALDSSNNAYVTGYTSSPSFAGQPGPPNTSSVDTAKAVFVTKLNSSGSAIVFAKVLDPNGGEAVGRGIAVDSSGDACVTGYTNSPNFPTTAGAPQKSLGGTTNAFVFKLKTDGTDFVYSTFLGGSSNDLAYGIAVDSSGNAYVTGKANSSNFPTTSSAFQTNHLQGQNVFVTALNDGGTAFLYSTYLGGGAGFAITADFSGNAYVTGQAASDFPTTVGALQTSAAVGGAFVAKLNNSGSALIYSTRLGGNGQPFGDVGQGIALDSSGNAYVTGLTGSTDFPTTPGAVQPALGCTCLDVFLVRLNSNGSALLYSTYLGGSASPRGDDGRAVAVDSLNNAYITGRTQSLNFPTSAGALRTLSPSGISAFVTKIGFTPSTTSTLLTVSRSTFQVGEPVTLTAAISSPGGTPFGTLTFFDGASLLSLLPLVSGGQFSTSLLTEGAHTLTAQFTPINEEAFAASTSNAVTVRVVTFGDIPLLSGGNTFTGNQTVNGTVTALNFSGNGSSLTNLNPANIGPGAAAINITGTAATALIATSAMTAMNATNLGGVPAAKYARLDLGNTFSGHQTVTGDVSASGDVTTAGSLVIGGGTAIKQYVSATFAITVPSLKPSSCTQLTQTLQAVGSGTNDTVALGVPNSFMSGGGFLIFQAWESAPSTIKIRICNLSPAGPPATSATGVIRVDLFKH